ncbi:D-alanyl-D-alanine carboxypeptidase [Brevibacillus sp. SYP-B805]|uniref:D-alanyl-D-alanine carboxypeptidase family protein n=1 Tax=Brevibacillus sp. SYP-B805 TaxID=1578199 RepID=UPI0013ED2AF1|nr:D-alanyl-D-alanine carboxypeptidase family protein [Brevibacillus sp. SYP-B805]NGQ96539.1 D-alanyl-D-alanine carboxypeptidase [Brevibacillus sp. SYP-B805]
MRWHRWTKRLAGIVLSVALFGLAGWGGASTASADTQANLQLEAKSAILVEPTTGKVLYSMNPDVPLPPASMSKMMTEYLVLEALKQNKIKWDEKVPVSEYAFYVARIPDSAGVYLNAGEEHSVKDLYKAMAIASANDATVLLAEKVGGSEANFVKMMNEKAAQLGMKNSSFVTSTGLPANELGPYSYSNEPKENQMSARDAAILARALIRDFPEALEYSKIPRMVFREGTPNAIPKANYNWMLPGLPNTYPGVDGLKTGYTAAAGYCFTGTATRDGMRLISVVMGVKGQGGVSGETKRFAETKKLFDYGFSTYKLTKVLDKGATIAGSEAAPVKKGVELTVPAVTGSVATVVTKVGEEKKYKPTVVFNDLTAPIKKGQAIGKLTFKAEGAGNEEYLQPEDAQKGGIEIVANQDVEEASWIRLFFRGIIQFIKNLFANIVG